MRCCFRQDYNTCRDDSVRTVATRLDVQRRVVGVGLLISFGTRTQEPVLQNLIVICAVLC